MSKLLRRTILPAITIVLIVFFVVLESSKKPNDSLYDAGSHIFDSISHLSFVDGQLIEQKPPNQPFANEQLKQINSTPDNSLQPTKQEDEEKKKLKEKEEEEKQLDPCTVFNPISKGFIDLSGLSSSSNEGKALPWGSKGYDSGKNYTIGVCSSPFKKHHSEINEIQDNLNSSLIGAYYVDPESKKYVSMGKYSTVPKFRGRKLTLTYENGSYCDIIDKNTNQRLRKSTILTFTCDREMSARALVSYIGQANECTYFFEVRSHHACPTAAKANNLAAVWIFLFIFLAAVFVYFSGGLLYRQMKQASTTRSKV